LDLSEGDEEYSEALDANVSPTILFQYASELALCRSTAFLAAVRIASPNLVERLALL
jgi:hypothetical protein